jgi:hypothetical protein
MFALIRTRCGCERVMRILDPIKPEIRLPLVSGFPIPVVHVGIEDHVDPDVLKDRTRLFRRESYVPNFYDRNWITAVYSEVSE